MAKKSNKFNSMKAEDVTKRVSELRETLREIRFKAEGARSKNVKEVGQLKKELAQALTTLNSNK